LIITDKVEEAHPRFRSCLAADCNHGQVHHRRNDPCVRCEACGAMSCFTHGIPWHHDHDCDSYDDMHPDAISLQTSEELVRDVGKKCPGAGCMFYVEKVGGCDNVYCSRCQHNWYWSDVKFDYEGAVGVATVAEVKDVGIGSMAPA